MDLKIAFGLAILLSIAGFIAFFSGTPVQSLPAQNQEIFLQTTIAQDTVKKNQEIQVNVSASNALELVFFADNKKTSTQKCSQQECNATFRATFYEKGIHFIEVQAITQSNSKKTKHAVRVIEAIQTCIDQTELEQCSKEKPFFCNNGTLEQNCEKCSCPQEKECVNTQCIAKKTTLEITGLTKEAIILKGQKPVLEIILKTGQHASIQTPYTIKAEINTGQKKIQRQKNFFLPKDMEPNQTAQITIEFFDQINQTGIFALSLELTGGQNPVTKKIENALRVLEPDNTPPASPEWLDWQKQENTIQLNWTQNTEQDLAGYLLYENMQENPAFITYSLKQSLEKNQNFATITVPSTGLHFFVLKAIDLSGNQSEYSKVLKIEQ